MERREFLAAGALSTLSRKRKPVWSVQAANQFVITDVSDAIVVYVGTPGLNTIMLAISPTSGTDQYGNSLNAGLNIYTFTGGGGGEIVFFLNGSDPNNQYASRIFQDNSGLNVHSNNGNPFTIDAPFQASTNSFPVRAYYAEVFLSALVIVTNTATILTALTLGEEHTDYGSAWNLVTGVWTCPVTDIYLICLSHAYTNWVANSRQQAVINRNGTAIGGFDDTNAHGPAALSPVSCYALRKLVVGDQLTFSVLQNTAANQTIRVFDGSYISIGRYI